MAEGWRNVSRREPCPICQKPDWCGVSADGAVCHCMRVESPNPCPSGGWFHFLVERPRQMPARTGPKPPVRPRLFNAAATMAGPCTSRKVFPSMRADRVLISTLLAKCEDA